ncbi:multidrug effflux MFS transporter [Sphingomonas daechungensis]|uniref:Bcr/CflA family efflux transporter n=1 Tax=Sphingomonas daechungensis TaxID=1176646 RepID=A0ABX6SZY2_9SPHN|nr:multidrug effflux MFS transporter [Sphingomonas daechungensis]QNP42734.1 multidrug effflux MFS transporter [Sphingomonas daechungensis]
MPFNLHQLPGSGPRPGPRETIALLAGLMALNAFAIDAMVPALPDIGWSLHVVHENDQQLVIVAYFVGFASTQLIWGPLADRFGRKPILAAGVALYMLFALLCGLAGSFPLLIAGRVAMGASAAVTRVLVVAMVRDLFEGEAMARVMSLVFMVFMVVPVLAPSIGQVILLFGSWRAIFLVFAGYGLLMLTWSWVRLPETLHPEYRRSLAPDEIISAAVEAVKEPLSRGYTLALTATFGALVAYISSIQQIVAEAFHQPHLLGLVFGAIAAPMALASWTNARVVGRFGLRRVGHGASAAFLAVALVHLAVGVSGHESLVTFIILQALTMVCFAFASSNLSTLAMDRMAAIAGTASSVQGVVGTIGAAIIGYAIGQAFNGTVLPFLWGMAGCALAGSAFVVLTEPGRLFAGPTAASEQPEPPAAAEA